MRCAFDKDSVAERANRHGFRHDPLTMLRIFTVEAGPR